MADFGQIFASERGVPHFIALAGVNPCQYRHKWYIVKNSWAYISTAESIGVSSTTLRNKPQKPPNSVKLRCGY